MSYYFTDEPPAPPRAGSFTRIDDVRDAERAYDDAVEAMRAYTSDPDAWTSSHEAVDADGRRSLHLTSVDVARLEQLQGRIDAAARQLTAVRAAFVEGR
jgi:hypothetical protein